MKRQITFAIALLLVVGAALWGVNYRLDHPPLTDADKEFRALIAGADSVEIFRLKSNTATPSESFDQHIILNEEQSKHLIENLRFSNTTPTALVLGSNTDVFFSLTFKNQANAITSCSWKQTPMPSEINMQCLTSQRSKTSQHSYKLNPRFNKRLNRALDAYLPQRVRP